MTWWDILVSLFFFVLLYVFFQLGVATEHWKQESREEAIRAQAYKDGRKSMFNELNGADWTTLRKLQMTDDEYRRMYMGTWTAPEKDTKESS